ncbi:MAG: cupin [Alphaproteobacteria bacterium]|nr:cupin [Alphaproteobacteria bacterium]
MTFVTTPKPWGKEILCDKTSRYALKDIHVKAGSRTSLQSHVHKEETILVISGRISVESGPSLDRLTTTVYGPDEGYTLFPGTIHRVTALEDARYVEASTPELDDVIRYADDYGRAQDAG